jgi:CheY-like chemotaxis protein
MTQPRIWIVDDNPDDQILIKTSFERIHCERYPLFIDSGDSLIEYLDACEPEEQPSLIVLDFRMRGMDGVETIERIKENPFTKDIPVIIYTSLVTDLTKGRFARQGVLMVLEKGTDLDKLCEQAKFFVELVENPSQA